MRALVFGASGFLGSEVCRAFLDLGATVDTPGREEMPSPNARFDAIVFAQGVNLSGSLESTSSEDMLTSFHVNTVFVVEKLQSLLKRDAFSEKCSVVILSSVWQQFSRKGKLPYVTSKSALGGLVRALAAELAGRARVNAVLPGVIDSPMAKGALTSEQIRGVTQRTPIARLVTPEEVASLVIFLSSEAASGVNGESILIDGGWTATIEV